MAFNLSTSRCINVPVNPNTPLDLMLAFYAKHPADTQNFQVNANAWLADAGTVIAGVPTVTCSSSDIQITNVLIEQGITQFTVTGGLDLTTYGLTFAAALADGTSLTVNIWLPVLSNSLNTTTPVVIAKGDKGDPGLPGLGLGATISLAGLLSITDANGVIWTIQLAQAVSQSGGNADFTSDFTPDFS